MFFLQLPELVHSYPVELVNGQTPMNRICIQSSYHLLFFHKTYAQNGLLPWAHSVQLSIREVIEALGVKVVPSVPKV